MKRFSIVILLLAFVFLFSACDNNAFGSGESFVSEAVSEESSQISSTESQDIEVSEMPDESGEASDVSPMESEDESEEMSVSYSESEDESEVSGGESDGGSDGESEVSEEVSIEESEPEVSLPILKDKELADISLYVKGIYFDIRYATENNIAGKVIYDDDTPYLRYGTVKKLLRVVEELNEYGYTLLVWDAYRKVEYQWVLWEAFPDPTYVANPHLYYSDHSRGDAIDVTLVTLDGKPIEMPTDHDDFTKKADRDYGDVSDEAAKNAVLLEKVMKKHGFKGYESEWWHFSDTIKYSVIK